MSIQAPSYTQFPNAIIDDHVANMKEAELRVTIAIIRETFGWQRKSARLSISDLESATHLSRQGVINGLNSGINRGTIGRVKEGQSYRYEMVISPRNEVDQLDVTSQRSRPVLVNEVDQLDATSQRSRLVLVNEVDQLDATSQRSRPVLVNEVDQLDATSQRSRLVTSQRSRPALVNEVDQSYIYRTKESSLKKGIKEKLPNQVTDQIQDPKEPKERSVGRSVSEAPVSEFDKIFQLLTDPEIGVNQTKAAAIAQGNDIETIAAHVGTWFEDATATGTGGLVHRIGANFATKEPSREFRRSEIFKRHNLREIYPETDSALMNAAERSAKWSQPTSREAVR